jgi:hypothetical protein
MLFKRGRGQISGFAILGIVLVAVVILLFFLRDQIGIVLPGNLGGTSADIGEHIRDCLQDVAPEYIERIGLQGGYLSTPEDTFRLYEGTPVSMLCYDIEGQSICRNRMLTLSDMEQELSEAIDQGLNTCINFGLFQKKGYDLTIGQRDVQVEIGPSVTKVTMIQPLHVVKGDTVVDHQEFFETFDVPLGRLYDVSQDIVNAEASMGEFDQLPYMLAHKGQYIIEKKKPYPDKLYILQTKDHPYLFQFFIEGEPTST